MDVTSKFRWHAHPEDHQRYPQNHVQKKWTVVEIDWTPGHSAIAGNEVPDKLTNEAVLEASQFTEDKTTPSHSEVKIACQKFTMTQWQKRWELSDIGKVFYNLFPSVAIGYFRQAIPSSATTGTNLAK